MKNTDVFYDRRGSIYEVKMTGTNYYGRYGILTQGTVSAVSFYNGVRESIRSPITRIGNKGNLYSDGKKFITVADNAKHIYESVLKI